MAKVGDWVQIHVVVLTPDERASTIPEDTRRLPLEMWVKGSMQSETAEIGDTVSVKTRTGRLVEGKLCAVNPCFSHSFGDFIPELMQIDDCVKSIVFGGDDNA